MHANHIKICSSYSLKNLNTFSIDVKTKYFAEFSTVSELKTLLQKEEIKNQKLFILGGGSNVLFTKNFDGVVLKNNILGKEVIEENNEHVILKVGAGENWDKFVNYCVENKLAGLENLSLIPGTVGASPIQNIGAYGIEVKDVIDSVEVLNLDTSEIELFLNNKCKFGYRYSIFKNELKDKIVVTSVLFKLKKNPNINLTYQALANEVAKLNLSSPSISDVRNTVIRIRESKLPNEKEYPNAGSFFKNPEVDKVKFNELKEKFDDLKFFEINENLYKIPAGWMIDKCGLKGVRKNNVGTFSNQALVIVNYNEASGLEVKKFSEEIKNKVFGLFGINLETEVNII